MHLSVFSVEPGNGGTISIPVSYIHSMTYQSLVERVLSFSPTPSTVHIKEKKDEWSIKAVQNTHIPVATGPRGGRGNVRRYQTARCGLATQRIRRGGQGMVAIFMDTKNRPIGWQIISIGTLNSTLVEPRELFKTALLANANGIIISHNHPSGDLTPSRDDDELMCRIARAGQLLSVKLLDHVILGLDGGYYSYMDHHPEFIRV